MKAYLFFCIPVVFMAQFAQAQTHLSAKGTGRTTGHIATILFQNNSGDTVEVLPQIVYIPSVGQFQSYVGRIPGWSEVLAGATIALPVDGYCTDVQAPPVASGVDMRIADWIPVGEVPAISAEPKFLGDKPMVVMATHAPAPPFSRDLIGNIISSNVFTPVKPDEAPTIKPVWPGTNIPVDGTIDPNKNPAKVAPMLVKAVQEIENAVTTIQQDPTFTTPFSPDPAKEKEAVVQQTVWIYAGALTAKPYEEKDFKENVYQQYQSTTGASPKSLPKSEKEKVDGGVADFWNVFMAVGMEAKVLKNTAGNGK